MAKQSEEKFAEKIVIFLQNEGWEIFQEVEPLHGRSVADIVAVKDRKVLVVECKLALGISVMSQAWHWKNYADYIAVAVPTSACGFTKEKEFCYDILRKFGIGLITASGLKTKWNICTVKQQASQRATLLKSLNEQHKTWAKAGNNQRKKWSPFQQTVSDILAYVFDNPGCDIDDMLKDVSVHYKNKNSAKNSILRYIKSGVIKDMSAKTANSVTRLYVKTKDSEHS